MSSGATGGRRAGGACGRAPRPPRSSRRPAPACDRPTGPRRARRGAGRGSAAAGAQRVREVVDEEAGTGHRGERVVERPLGEVAGGGVGAGRDITTTVGGFGRRGEQLLEDPAEGGVASRTTSAENRSSTAVVASTTCARNRSPRGVRRTSLTRRSPGSVNVARWPVRVSWATNWPHPCLVMPIRSARTVTLAPSTGTPLSTRTWENRSPSIGRSASSERRRAKRAGQQLGENFLDVGHKATLPSWW